MAREAQRGMSQNVFYFEMIVSDVDFKAPPQAPVLQMHPAAVRLQ